MARAFVVWSLFLLLHVTSGCLLTVNLTNNVKDQSSNLSLDLNSSCSVSVNDVLYRRAGDNASIIILLNGEQLASIVFPVSISEGDSHKNSGNIGKVLQLISGRYQVTVITKFVEVSSLILSIECLTRDPGVPCTSCSSKGLSLFSDEDDTDNNNLYIVLGVITAAFLIFIVLVVLALLQNDCCSCPAKCDAVFV